MAADRAPFDILAPKKLLLVKIKILGTNAVSQIMEDNARRQLGTERLVSGGMWFLGLTMFSGIFWMVGGVLVSRAYGPSGYGLFSMALSLFDFIWAFIFGGLFEGMIHFGSGYVAKDCSNLAQYFSNYVRYLTGISFFVFTFFTVASFQVSDTILRIIFLSLAAAFLLSGTKDALASIIGSLQNSKQLSMVNASRFYVISLIGLIFILLSIPFYFLPLLLLFGTVCQLLLCMYFLRHYLNDLISCCVNFFRQTNLRSELLADLKQFRLILIFGFFVSIRKISFNVMKSLDIAVLKLFFGYADIGVYGVADTVSSVLFLMTAFSLPIISSISEAWAEQDHVLLEKYVSISVKYSLIVGIPSTVIILTLAEPIILGVYGAAFQGAVVPLQILIIGTFLLMFGYTLSSILVGIGKAKLSGLLMASTTIQYALSLYVLIPALGIRGAAISLTLTGIMAVFLFPFFIRENIKTKVFSGSLKVLFSGAVLALLLFLIPKSNWLLLMGGLVAGMIIYVLLLRYTGYINKEDIAKLKNSIRLIVQNLL